VAGEPTPWPAVPAQPTQGTALLLSEKYEEARQSYSRGLELDPENRACKVRRHCTLLLRLTLQTCAIQAGDRACKVRASWLSRLVAIHQCN